MNSKNLALVVEYDGANYCGFQKQQKYLAVQNILDLAISKVANHKVQTIGSGRTDSSVHALFQIVNFISYNDRTLNNWLNGINSLLPNDIVIKEIQFVPNSFNARFSAIERTYHYYLYIANTRTAILNSKVGYYNKELNLQLINEALNLIKGEKDFSCFKAENSQTECNIRNMYEAKMSIKKFSSHQLIRFEFTANGFLYHMIRNIMSTLIYIGSNKMSLLDLQHLLESKNRKLAPYTFMADGLYLVNIIYNDVKFTSLNLDWIF